MISSYEEYMLKSHLLSKMYLQQYCSVGLNIAKNTNSSDKPSKGEAHNVQTVHFTDLISAEKSSKASEGNPDGLDDPVRTSRAHADDACRRADAENQLQRDQASLKTFMRELD